MPFIVQESLITGCRIVKVAHLIFFSSAAVFSEIRRKINGQCGQAGLQQGVLAVLHGACLLTH